MTRKVSELDLALGVGNDDYTIIVQGGQTKRYKPADLLIGLTKDNVGLNNLGNYPVASQAEAQAGVATDRYMTPLRTAQAIAALVNQVQRDRYDLKIASSTGALDLAAQQIFTINATANRTITFSNTPGADRSMTVVIELQGSGGAITWPTITWSGGKAPTLGTTLTVVVLFWTGTKWIGSVSASV